MAGAPGEGRAPGGGTPLEDNREQLLRLARLETAKAQRQAAEAVLSGQSDEVPAPVKLAPRREAAKRERVGALAAWLAEVTPADKVPLVETGLKAGDAALLLKLFRQAVRDAA